MIPYGKQSITDSDIQAVVDVLKSDFLTQGPAVPKFEEAVTSYCGTKFGVAVNSATSALHLACRALGVKEGDRVWTSPITFVASANCALYCGAEPDFVDICPRTYNLCPEALRTKLEEAEKTGTLPKVVIPVHLCGQSCDMAAIHALSKTYGFNIIEDASHAIGGKYQGEPIGNCRYSDITVFSFHPVKIITTGEGGLAVTQNEELANKMSLLRSHGITREPSQYSPPSPTSPPWYYQQIDLGYNYRMTDIQAALGANQMTRLDEFVTRRNEQADRYDTLLEPLPLTLPQQNPNAVSARHLYVIRVDEQVHERTFHALREQGIGVNLHYIPVHTQPWYRDMGFKTGDFPEAEQYYREAISLPIFPRMTDEEQDSIADTLHKILSSL